MSSPATTSEMPSESADINPDGQGGAAKLPRLKRGEDDDIKALRKFRRGNEAKKIVNFVHDQQQKMGQERNREKQQWQINLAYYNKLQDAKILPKGSALNSGGGLHVPGIKTGKSRKLFINRVRPTVRTEIAKLVSQKPGISVVPSSSDMSDMFAARSAENVFHSISYRRNFHAVLSDAMFWLSITGNGFMKTYWDEGIYDQDSELWGDINFSNVSPFNLLVPDLRETDIERQPFVIEMYTKPLEWLKQFYKRELDGTKVVASTVTSSNILETKYLNTSESQPEKDSCVVFELWVKPGGHELFPDGGFVVMIDKTIVLIEQTLPYSHGMYPYTHFGHVPSGKFYRTSVIEDIIDLQDSYNENVNLIRDTRNKMGKVQLAATKGSISAAKMTNEIGLLIEHKPGTPPPQVMQPSGLPAYILDEQQRILMDIEDLSGQHQVSKGSAPPGVTAATAISFLQEKDDSYMSPTIQSVEGGVEKIGKCTLTLVVEFWDEPRVVKVAGDDSVFDVQELLGADIAEGTDLRVEAGSALPQSKAARQAFILELMNTGHISSEAGLEMLEVGGSQKLMETLQQDKRHAHRENIRLKKMDPQDIEEQSDLWEETITRLQQEMPEMGFEMDMEDTETGLPLKPLTLAVNEWDNHEVHIETHNSFRKTQEFEMLDPPIKEAFQQHVERHEQQMQIEMLKEMLGAIPTDGSVPGMSSMGMGGEAGAEGEDPEGEAPEEEGEEQASAAPIGPDADIMGSDTVEPMPSGAGMAPRQEGEF